MRPADRLRRGLGEAEIADLPLVLEPRHLAHRILDRHVGIDAVLVIKVDHLDPEPLEARLAGGVDIFGVAAHPEELAIGPAHIGELEKVMHSFPRDMQSLFPALASTV